MEKKLFCINITNNDNNQLGDEQPLVIRKIDGIHEEELRKIVEKHSDYIKKESPTKAIIYFFLISLFISVFDFVFLISSIVDQEGSTINRKIQLYALSVLIISIIISTILFIYMKRKHNRLLVSEEYIKGEKRIEELINISKEDLNIPSNTLNIDLLCCFYKVNDGVIKPFKKKNCLSEHDIVDKEMYVSDSFLYIADIGQVVEIPLESIVSIEAVNKKMKMPLMSCRKPVSQRKILFKKYKIKVKEMTFIMKSYYVVNIEIDHQLYQLELPLYEIDEFKTLIGY